MRLSLRWRIVLMILPALLLLFSFGIAAVIIMQGLGIRIGAILRENYRSVVYMERLNEALERIDSSFNFALAGREEPARKQYDENWPVFRENIENENRNITLPGEEALANRLSSIAQQYHDAGQAFFQQKALSQERVAAYHNPSGLLDLFKGLKSASGEIRRINQDNMELASEQAKQTAATSLVWFTSCLAVAAVLSGLLAWHMTQTVLHPIQALTDSAKGISEGNLDQVVPSVSNDEIGQLAQAFNVMARHLREFRQSQSAQLVRAQKTSQATIDSFPDPVLVIDAEGNVELANPAARRLLSVVPKQAEQRVSGTWQPPVPLQQPLADALTGHHDYLPESFDQVILLSSNESERALLPRILTIRDAEQNMLGAAVLLQDVTRLRLLDQMKSNLVATASHELKTPLTSLRLVVHLLLEESTGPLSPKQIELLLDARENSERLLAVVNNLLDLARLEQGWRQLDVRAVWPRSLLQAGMEYIQARAADKNVSVDLDLPRDLPAVSVDAERIGHAISNLLDNALTYTDPGGHIRLSARPDGDAVVFSVADTGQGIPADHIPHLFEKFFRVPGGSRGQGTGLGLAIVNEIVTANRGTISCESKLGKGTVFHIRLPVALKSP